MLFQGYYFPPVVDAGPDVTLVDYTTSAVLQGQVQESYQRIVGWKSYELKDHLGNIRVVVGDEKLATVNGATLGLRAAIRSYANYYPFGMNAPGGNWSAGSKYRYGFNGKEQDTDFLNNYDYGFRIYNPTIGKFLSVDPLASSYPWNSTYAFAEGDPINFIDLDGLEKGYPPIYQQFLDAFRSFRVQTTSDINKIATNNDVWTTSKKPPVLRIGDVYEDACLRSYGLTKAGSMVYSPSGRGVLPDATDDYEAHGAETIEMGGFIVGAIPHTVIAKGGILYDAKYAQSISLELRKPDKKTGKIPNGNTVEQAKTMVDYLASQKGLWVDGVYHADASWTAYGLAAIVYIVPSNAFIGNINEQLDIISYAASKGVQVFARYTEVDKNDLNRMRVSKGGNLTFFLKPQKSLAELFGKQGPANKQLNVPVLTDDKPSVEMNWNIGKKD